MNKGDKLIRKNKNGEPGHEVYYFSYKLNSVSDKIVVIPHFAWQSPIKYTEELSASEFDIVQEPIDFSI